MDGNWTQNNLDVKIARSLQSLLPGKVFDMHAHLYRLADLNLGTGMQDIYTEGPGEANVEIWRKYIGNKVGEQRLKGALFIATPTQECNIDGINMFLIEQLKMHPGMKGLIYVTPECPRRKIHEYLTNPQITGFKPYHYTSKEKPTFQSSIRGFLPEWIWQIAEERELIITLHMVRDRALSDPDNQREIREMCLKYPHVKLILAHAARGFHAPNTVAGITTLRGLENVWFDTSAICEAAALVAILNEFGPRRLMWGSDFPVSEIRGRAVTVGDGFAWLQSDTVYWDKLIPGCNPILVGLESLKALLDAAEEACLSSEDLQDIFYNNAMRLLGFDNNTASLTGDLYNHAKIRIPGGTQLLSKRPEMMAPGQWPAYFREARGCETWDLDGNHYYDMSTNGIGSCLLGFRDPDVTRAVKRRINFGSMCSLNPPEEVELADMLCDIHPWAEQVRFTRGGGEAASVAIRIARAVTNRSVVAICGYHGWHDWYLAANLGEDDALRGHLLPGLDPLGVPVELRNTAITFKYNDRDEIRHIIEKTGNRLAAVIMEPCRYKEPEPGYLEFVRNEVCKCGALLIFDEITIGWRLCYGGSHLKLGVNPDIALFSKALGNGHPIGAVIGTRKAMEGASNSFISSTYWTESIGPVAALATLNKMRKTKVYEYVDNIGSRISEYWKCHSMKHRIPVDVENGYYCLAHFAFKHDKSEELRTLYTQLMLERGFLAGVSIYPTLAHDEEIVYKYGQAVDEVFGRIAKIIKEDVISESLKGPVANSGFRRLL